MQYLRNWRSFNKTATNPVYAKYQIIKQFGYIYMDNQLFSQVKAGNLYGTLEVYANDKVVSDILKNVKPEVLKKLSQRLDMSSDDANDTMPSAEEFAKSVKQELAKLAKEEKGAAEKKGDLGKGHPEVIKPFLERNPALVEAAKGTNR
jgi:hypothetical protein